jgi:hypothetical protein
MKTSIYPGALDFISAINNFVIAGKYMYLSDNDKACNEICSTYYVSGGIYGFFSRMLIDQQVIIEPTLLNVSACCIAG